METQQFCEELTEILQVDEELTLESVLSELTEWDSMAHLGVISMFDIEFSKTITNSDLKTIKSVRQLFELAVG